MADQKKIDRLLKIAREIESSVPKKEEVHPDRYDKLSSVISNAEVLENSRKHIISNEKTPFHEIGSDEFYYKLDDINYNGGKKSIKIRNRFDILDL